MLHKREVNRDSALGKELMQQIYDLRLETYDKLGWIPYSKGKSRMVEDIFDHISHTTHFAIMEDKKLIGCNRMTQFSPEFKLPLFKDGLNLELFGASTKHISEGSRLVIMQNRKYPKCVLQLLFHSTDYILNNTLSKSICSIGNPEHNKLFEYMGINVMKKNVECILDENEDKKVVVPGTLLLLDKPMFADKLGLNNYPIDRTFVVIKSE